MNYHDVLAERPVFRVAITYGHQTTKKQPIEPARLDDVVAYLKGTLCGLCGGTRVNSDPGVYRHSDGSVVDEGSTTIWAFSLGTDVPFNQLVRTAREVGRRLEQETVLLAIERVAGVISFVRSDGEDDPQPLSTEQF